MEQPMMSMDDRRSLERLLNPKEVAEYLGLKKTTIHRLLADGTTPALNITGSTGRVTLLVRPSALLERLNGKVWYAWQGSNLRPSVPETDALVQLSYRRTILILFDLASDSNP